MMLRKRRSFAPCLVLAALALAGCGEEKKRGTEETVDAGPPKPVLGGKLGAAVAAAESAQAQPSGSGAPADGPPETGVFAPGAADKAHAPNAPVSVQLLDQGAEPRVQLALAPPDEQKATVAVTLRLGQQGGALDYGLTIRADRPKDDKAKKDEKKDEAEARKPVRVIAKVTSLTPQGQAPKEALDQLAKVKGSEIRYQLTPEGAVTDLAVALAKDADPGLDTQLRVLAETLTLLTPPLPGKPVGKGAYWMASDRGTSLGIDVVRYRVFRVEGVDKDRVSFSIDVRQYAAKDDTDIGGPQAKGLKIGAFESKGSGKAEWTPAGFLPQAGSVMVQTGARIMAPGAGQRGAMMLQTQVDAKLAPGGKDEGKAGKK